MSDAGDRCPVCSKAVPLVFAAVFGWKVNALEPVIGPHQNQYGDPCPGTGKSYKVHVPRISSWPDGSLRCPECTSPKTPAKGSHPWTAEPGIRCRTCGYWMKR